MPFRHKNIRPPFENCAGTGWSSSPSVAQIAANFSLLRWAGDLATITPRTKQYLWTQMGIRGFRKHEPVEIPPEEPTLLKELLDFHRDRLGHDQQNLAKIMQVKESELMEEYLRDGSLGGLRLLRAVN